MPACVADAIRDYLTSSFVQLGAGYRESRVATELVDEAHAFANEFMNGAGIGQTILGPSTSQLCAMLAECYGRRLAPGDEIVIAECGHEANVGPWARLAARGMVVKTWAVNLETHQSPISGLEAVLSERTKIVAFPHVSNLLGEIVNVKAASALAHKAGARVVVDGVAYAPHREIDVADWDADWYVYSIYKVYGPHMAAMFGKSDAFAELKGPNHFFIEEGTPYKFEVGGVLHEACAGLLALRPYLNFLAGHTGEIDHGSVRDAFETIKAFEVPLQERLIGYLLGKPQVRIVGPANAGEDRVCTISFVHQSKSAPEIVAETDKRGIGIRYGHMYAYRLCEALGIDTDAGVVRVSGVHYNTVDEVDRLIEVFESVL